MDPATPATAGAESNGTRPHQGLTMADFDARIRRYNSDLQQDSLAYRAAVILLAGAEFGHNIDRIARRTGYPRPLVSQVARRLIDNGVWNAGVTVADWSSSEHASGTFWNDVAVAEGKMCRRIGPDGRIEWAPAGFWNKSFQFVDAEADKLSTLYHDAGAPQTEAPIELQAVEPATTDAPPEPAMIGMPAGGSSESGDMVHAFTVIGGSNGSNGNGHVDETEIVGPAPGKPAILPAVALGRSTVPALDDLFRNTVWIG